jgi:Domain of unknown function (DUF5060)
LLKVTSNSLRYEDDCSSSERIPDDASYTAPMKYGSTSLTVLLLWTALLAKAQSEKVNAPLGGQSGARQTKLASLVAVAEPTEGDSSVAGRETPKTLDRIQNNPEKSKLADNRPLKIFRVSADKDQVKIYDVVELTAEIAASYNNPFDPDQISIEAKVTAPDGKVLSVPGFFYAPMRLETEASRERLKPAGAPDFRVRYTPTTVGNYRLIVQVTDRSGTVKSQPITIRATKGVSPGFIRVGRFSQYFAFDNGKPYFAIGENLCWSGRRTPVADYTRWLHGLGAAGANWARLWLSYNEKGLEWMPPPTPKPGVGDHLGLGWYALDNAWRLDKIVRLA